MRSIRTALIQFKAESRVNFTNPAILTYLVVPLFFVFLARHTLADATPEEQAMVVAMQVSAITAFATLTIFNIFSECYTERISGTFVRIRTLPHGVQAWMLAKVLFQELTFVVTAIFWVAVIAVLLPNAGVDLATAAGLVLVSVIGVLAFAPFGFMVGMVITTMYGFTAAMLISIFLFVATGGFFPTAEMPTWAGYLSLLSPFYWMGYVARALQLGAAGAQMEIIGVLSAPLGLGIIGLWGVIGWMIGPKVVQAMMRKETIGNLNKQRDSYRELSGL